MKNNKPKNKLNKFARFSGMAFQMLVTLLIGVFIGQYFDKKFPNDNNIYTLIFSLIFIGASLYVVIKQALKLGNND